VRPYILQCWSAASIAGAGDAPYHCATPPWSVPLTDGEHAARQSIAMSASFRMDHNSLPPGHDKMALQFSGGKDSLALAYLLKPYWGRLTFYHLDTGDLLPEIRDLVALFAAKVPHFVRV